VPVIIQTVGLRKSFRSRAGVVEAVRGVDLTVEACMIFGFLGPNGAGKTTTVRLLATLGKVNPFYWAVEAARDLIVGELASGTVLLGFGLTAALAVIALAWAAPASRRVAA
jgi:ATPase subunit of ABC transporter with duplicated ATPase domains